MTRKKKDRHAVALGRLGGSVGSEAQAEARRANGRLGGRPTKLVTVGAGTGVQREVHADAVWIGYTTAGAPAFLSRSAAASHWLRRHGYEYATWSMREVFDELPRGKCWA